MLDQNIINEISRTDASTIIPEKLTQHYENMLPSRNIEEVSKIEEKNLVTLLFILYHVKYNRLGPFDPMRLIGKNLQRMCLCRLRKLF